MKNWFGFLTLLIGVICFAMSQSSLPSWADTAPPIPVTQGEAVTLTLKLINTGDVPLKGLTVHSDAATNPEWFVPEAVSTAVDLSVSENPYVLVPFRFTIDKGAPIGEVEPMTLRIEDVEGSVWHKRFVLDVQPRPTPKAFRLLQNYPNPFNPETWIPYELKAAANVQISVYDSSGRRVRTLSIGFKAADFYTARSEAAYWDGRNETGERVASGLYFYHLQAGSFSGMRKMLILK